MNLREQLKKITLLDKYILKQVIEMFIMGVLIFTSIIFASDTFITLIKQIAKYGIPFKIAFMLVILSLPSVFVMTIPMGILLSTVMTLNKLSLDSELTVMRACGIGFNRIAKPVFAFAILMAIVGFMVNETIVPIMTKQSKDLALWSFSQKNVPDGKHNFTFEEVGDGGMLKRLFYVEYCEHKRLHNITVLDTSKMDTIHVLQAKEGGTSPEGWVFNNGIVYTIADNGDNLNSTFFGESVAQFGANLQKEMNKNVANEQNFMQLAKYLNKNKKEVDEKTNTKLKIALFDKIALPMTTIVLVLIGIPLAITPPRVRYNRGFLFSILIIFVYYLIRALSISFGEAGAFSAFVAAFLPNIILAVSGVFLYYRKVFTIT